jgi:hypothetical protein
MDFCDLGGRRENKDLKDYDSDKMTTSLKIQFRIALGPDCRFTSPRHLYTSFVLPTT